MIPLSYFVERRQKAFDKMRDNSIAILSSSPIVYRNNDADYPYRQDSNFYYLTGVDESLAVAVLLKQKGKNQFILFCQKKNPSEERWTGERIGLERAEKEWGVSKAYDYKQLDEILPSLLNQVETLYTIFPTKGFLHRTIARALDTLRKKSRQGMTLPTHWLDLFPIISELRLIKTPEDLKSMQKACDISVTAHIEAMQYCKSGQYEYEIEAILLYQFCKNGARQPAYTSIVAGGENACTLHYTRNDALLRENQLLLIDAGAEYDFYAADITRTFPINGKFTKEQEAIYELVLAAQIAAIDQIKPGTPWDEPQKIILKVLVQGLVDLKILKGNVKDLIEEKAYFPFYMHNSGHWLGMDVHDVGAYQLGSSEQDYHYRPFVPGMTLTVEPGLYLSSDTPNLDDKWKGIGIRIEDDILVEPNGHKVLTQALPKTVSDIEKLMGK